MRPAAALELPRLLTNRKSECPHLEERGADYGEADYICQPHFLSIESGEADVE